MMINSRDLGGSIVYIYIYCMIFLCLVSFSVFFVHPRPLTLLEWSFVTFTHEQVGYLYLPLSVIMSYYVFNRAKAQRKEGGLKMGCVKSWTQNIWLFHVKFPGDVICICSRQPGGLWVPPVANGGIANRMTQSAQFRLYDQWPREAKQKKTDCPRSDP